jgi:hydrogenase maturation protease
VIGYGNDLRGDDAAGPRVAELIDARALPNVRAIAARQLTPDLAEQLARADMAVFVDAYAVISEAVDAEVATQPRRIEPAAGRAALRHSSDPRELLALALTLYGHAPPAWLIAVPALTFDLGAPLSPTAEQGILAAVRRIGDLLTSASSQ